MTRAAGKCVDGARLGINYRRVTLFSRKMPGPICSGAFPSTKAVAGADKPTQRKGWRRRSESNLPADVCLQEGRLVKKLVRCQRSKSITRTVVDFGDQTVLSRQ